MSALFVSVKADMWWPNGDSSPVADRLIAIAAIESIAASDAGSVIHMRSGVQIVVQDVGPHQIAKRIEAAQC